MNPIVEKVYQIGIIPVIAFNSVDEALPLCKALEDGGLPAAEVNFRTVSYTHLRAHETDSCLV